MFKGKPQKLAGGEWGVLITTGAKRRPAVGDEIKVVARHGEWLATIRAVVSDYGKSVVVDAPRPAAAAAASQQRAAGFRAAAKAAHQARFPADRWTRQDIADARDDLADMGVRR